MAWLATFVCTLPQAVGLGLRAHLECARSLRIAPVPRPARLLPLLLAVLGFCCAWSGATTAGAALDTNLRLRVAWGGGPERQWHGTIELAPGTLSALQPLGIEADEPGSIWLDESKVSIRQRSVRAYDGIDVLATADLSSKLVVRLWPVGHEDEAKRFDIQLKQLVTQSFTSPIDAGGNQLLVIRSPGDKLRVSFHRSSLVFAPGETFSATLAPTLLGLPGGTALRIKAQLTGPGGKGWSREFETVTPQADEEADVGIPLEIKLPDVEGVCDLTLTAINAALRERLPWKRPIAERKVQLVIVADKPQRAPTADSQTLVRLVEIDPTSPHSWERLTQLMSSARKENLGSGDTVAGIIRNWARSFNWDRARRGPAGKPTRCRSAIRASPTSWKSNIPATCRKPWASA